MLWSAKGKLECEDYVGWGMERKVKEGIQRGTANVKGHLKNQMEPGIDVHAFNPRIGRQRQMGLREFEASLLYVVSSRTVRTMYRDPV